MMITTCRILWMPGSVALPGPDDPDELPVHDVASSPAIAAAARRRSPNLSRDMRTLCSAWPPGSTDNAERTLRFDPAFHEWASRSQPSELPSDRGDARTAVRWRGAGPGSRGRVP